MPVESARLGVKFYGPNTQFRNCGDGVNYASRSREESTNRTSVHTVVFSVTHGCTRKDALSFTLSALRMPQRGGVCAAGLQSAIEYYVQSAFFPLYDHNALKGGN